MKKWALCALILLVLPFTTASGAIMPGSSGLAGSAGSGAPTTSAASAVPAAPASFGAPASPASPVLLTVYLYDRCGGCSGSVDTLGCGDCKDTVTLHGIIKKQLGDRLYDGSIEYRLLNCRDSIHEENCMRRGALYGVAEEWKYVRPVAYIGTEESGLYLPGEGAMPYIQEMLDRYIRRENAVKIQQDILKLID